MQMDTTRNAIHTAACTKGPGDSAQRTQKACPAFETELHLMQPPDCVESTVNKTARSNHPVQDVGLVGGPRKQIPERNKLLHSIEELGSGRWY